MKNIDENSKEFIERVKNEIVRINQYVGEGFIADARQTDTYIDRTSNLRNSIGYINVKNSVKSGSRFGEGIGGKEGKSEAEKLARSEVKDIGMVMVAGMEYAYCVEAFGYDVISNSVLSAKEKHQRMMEKYLKILAK